MPIPLTRRGAAILAMPLAVVAVLVIAPLGAAADEAPSTPPKLGIAPADRPGSWFDLELAPGDTEHLSVELANHGDQPLDAASYAADVYTLVGGGMGVRLRDEPTSGTTGWLDYPDRVENLVPDEAVRRTVTVTVPADTEPGQYLAALVIENDQPLAADGALSVERILRQALAVNITVPGPATPALAIGDADHTLTAGRSIVRLEIDNPGNRHLKPAGTLTLTDADGTTLASRDVTMDSIYAGTATHLEMTLDDPLTPGTYTLSAELSDPDFDVDAAGNASFEIAAPPPTERLVPGFDGVADALEATGLPAWTVLAAALLIVLILTVLVAVAHRRRRARRHAVPLPEPAESPTPATVPTAAVEDAVVNHPPPPRLFDPIAHMEATATRARHTARPNTPAPPVPPPPPPSPEPRHGTLQRSAPRPAAPPPPPRRTAPPTQNATVTSAPHAAREPSDPPGSPLMFTARTPPRRRRRSR